MYASIVSLILFFTLTANRANGWYISGGTANIKHVHRKGNTINNIATLIGCRHGICMHFENYPEKAINEAMEKQHTLQYLLTAPVIDSTTDFEITHRDQFNEYTSTQLCKSEGPMTFKPLQMRNVDSDWKLIVNTNRYNQTFISETCRHLVRPSSIYTKECTSIDPSFKCRQNYQMVSLVIYEEGRIRFDRFNIPTNCQCLCLEA